MDFDAMEVDGGSSLFSFVDVDAYGGSSGGSGQPLFDHPHPIGEMETKITKCIRDRSEAENFTTTRVHTGIFTCSKIGGDPNFRFVIFMEKDKRSDMLIVRNKACSIDMIPVSELLKNDQGNYTFEKKIACFISEAVAAMIPYKCSDKLIEVELIRRLIHARVCHRSAIYSGCCIRLSGVSEALASNADQFEKMVITYSSFIHNPSEERVWLIHPRFPANVRITRPRSTGMHGKSYMWTLSDNHLSIINLYSVPYARPRRSLTAYIYCPVIHSWEDIILSHGQRPSEISSRKLFFSALRLFVDADPADAKIVRMLCSPGVRAVKPQAEGFMPYEFSFSRETSHSDIKINELRTISTGLLRLNNASGDSVVSASSQPGTRPVFSLDDDVGQELLCSIISEVLISRKYYLMTGLIKCQLRWCYSDLTVTEARVYAYLLPLTQFIVSNQAISFDSSGFDLVPSIKTIPFELSGKRHAWKIKDRICCLIEVVTSPFLSGSQAAGAANPSSLSLTEQTFQTFEGLDLYETPQTPIFRECSARSEGGAEPFAFGRVQQSKFPAPTSSTMLRLLSSLDRALGN
jgi:hypothetical protein